MTGIFHCIRFSQHAAQRACLRGHCGGDAGERYLNFLSQPGLDSPLQRLAAELTGMRDPDNMEARGRDAVESLLELYSSLRL